MIEERSPDIVHLAHNDHRSKKEASEQEQIHLLLKEESNFRHELMTGRTVRTTIGR